MSDRLVSPVFVSRRGELERLAAALARASAGEPAVYLLSGEAGVGKSRLVDEASATFEAEGARTVKGMCVDLSGTPLPFSALVDALRALRRSASPQEFDVILGPARRELARLAPELDPDAGGEIAGEGPGGSSRLFELVLGLLGRAAEERPLALIVEDIHWSDPSMLDLLMFLARTLREERLLMLLTYRSDEVDRRHPLRGFLAELERLPVVQRLELHRLDRAGVAAQLQGMLGQEPAADLVDRVYERSEGNAFLVEEVLEIVRDGGAGRLSPSLRDVLLARIERVSPDAQQVLRSAAAGAPVGHALLAAVTGLGSGELDALLRECVDHHILVPDEDHRGYDFRHALVREAIYEDILPGERVRIHSAYAEALDADATLAESPVAAAGARARHWYAAHDRGRALSVSVEAARLASAAYAYREAQRLLELALELWPAQEGGGADGAPDHLDLLELAGTAALHAGDEHRALAMFAEALEQPQAAAEPTRVARLRWRSALAMRQVGRDPEPELMLAMEVLGDRPPTTELAAVLSERAALAGLRAELDETRELAEMAIEIARAVGDRRNEAAALAVLGWALAGRGDMEQGLDALALARQLSAEEGVEDVLLRAHIALTDVLAAAGRHREAIEAGREGIEHARTAGFNRTHGVFLRGNVTESLLRLGRLEDAERLLEETADFELSGAPDAFVAELRAELSLIRGDLAEAQEQVARLERGLPAVEDTSPQSQLPTALVRAEVLRSCGEPLEACRIAVSALELVTPDVPRYAWPVAWSGLRAARDAGLAADAEPVGVLEAVVARLAAPAPPDEAARALCLLELARLAGAPAAQECEAAVAASRASEDPYRIAYALWRQAEVQAEQAQDPAGAIREAAAVAEALGAQPLLESVRASARRADIELPGAGERGGENPLGLTARELDVLRLLAAGRSNGQIGEALFISRKTASVHVSNILAKLGVSSRGEAAAIAHRAGIEPLEGARP